MAQSNEEPALRAELHDNEDVVISLEGDLDPASMPVFSAAYEQALDALGDGATRLVLDMAGIRFIDSSGLRALLVAHDSLDDSGQQLVIRDPSLTVRRLLQITDLSDHFRTERFAGDS